jgi:diguanylate cyclase (GGDEF)-like protein
VSIPSDELAAAPSPWWRRLWSSPHPALADAGIHGEIVVAQGRLVLTLIIIAIPMAAALSMGWSTENVIGLSFAVFAALLAVVIYWIVSRQRRVPWLAFATSIIDVTTVSLLHVGYLIAGLPSLAANSRTTYAVYLLAIAATAMRWDVRVCIAAGAIATAQYTVIAATAWQLWAPHPTPETVMYGEIVPGQQAARLVVLIGATWLAAAVVRQSSALRYSATHDVLTGLQNRTYFEERFVEEIERARRARRALSVAMLDLDHFKRVNDAWGHGVGDAALRAVARTLKATVRSTDLVARYGGEEFAIVLTESGATEAATRVEEVRARVRASPIFVAPKAAPLTMTASAGVATFPDDGTTASDLVRVADERLLDAKRLGRDRIVAPE